jgi:hypothetical protein
MKCGVPPTDLNDLTGLFTPPGMRVLAFSNNLVDFWLFNFMILNLIPLINL